jgi:hypothetical protein
VQSLYATDKDSLVEYLYHQSVSSLCSYFYALKFDLDDSMWRLISYCKNTQKKALSLNPKKHLDQPELRDACPAEVGDFCAIKNLDVKRYHSENKNPRISQLRVNPSEFFVAIEKCKALKKGGQGRG